MRSAWVTFLVFSAMVVGTDAQTGRRPASPTFKTEAVALVCPSPLGQGVATQRNFCSIQADIEPSAGAIVRLPPHRGPATLSFDLHNRHMYSAELVDRGRGYTRATATIGVLAMNKTLLTRAVVQTEFRAAVDLFDRVAAGAGMAGVKAVAPIGNEPVTLEVAEGVNAVSILGEKLVIVGVDSSETITGAGRPIAVVSNVRLRYRPAPTRR
jgi:hypothetical protein